jgi:hypothetical protein
MNAAAEPEFTPAQIEHGIAHAIRDREFEVVPALLKLLAVQAPDRAQVIYDAIVHGRYTITIPIR